MVRKGASPGLDMGMVELCQGHGLVPEMSASGIIGERTGGKHFHSHIARELLIASPVNDTHAAGGDLLQGKSTRYGNALAVSRLQRGKRLRTAEGRGDVLVDDEDRKSVV